MKEVAREKYNQYHRQWASAHPDKIREYQRRYWIKKAATAAKEGVNNDKIQDQTVPGRNVQSVGSY